MTRESFNPSQQFHPSEADEDARLLSLIEGKNSHAFETLVTKYEQDVFQFALIILKNKEIAQDVSQDLFLEIWENPPKWKKLGKFSTYLYKAVSNRSLNKLNRWSVRNIFRLSLFPQHSIETFTTLSDTPEDEIIKDESHQLLYKAIDSLDSSQSAVIYLRYFKGLSIADIAKIQGVSYKSVESILYRAKQKLRMIMAK